MKTILIASSLLIATTLSAAAQTQSPQQACRSDAQKLCSDAIPNRQKVLACLIEKKDQLSSACKQALEAAGQ